MKDAEAKATADVPLAAPGLPMVVEDDALSAAYDAQFVPLRQAARAVHKHHEFVRKLCLAGKVLHRREGGRAKPRDRRFTAGRRGGGGGCRPSAAQLAAGAGQRILVNLPHLRRVLREMSIRIPGGGGAARPEDEALQGAPSATMHQGALQMLGTKRMKRGRKDG